MPETRGAFASSGRALAVVAIGLSLFQLWQPLAGFFPPGALPFEGLLGLLPAPVFRPAHLGWILVLGFAVHPLAGRPGLRALDAVGALLVLWATGRVIAFDHQGIDHLLHGLAGADLAAGAVLLLATLEIARRTVGSAMTAIGAVFLLYAAFGNLLPDAVATRGFSVERIVRFQVFTQAGLYGAPLGIAAGAVFSFVLFGAFLQSTGAGRFLIDVSFAVAGRSRGGPAKASVLASAAMGSISGSAIANTVTTGSLTIPMMKELGYRPPQAAGIEAAASTGGQIMPPIMGAGAFIMAEITGIPYTEIAVAAIIPAVLYFVSVYFMVDFEAAKLGMKGMREDELPKFNQMIRQVYLFIPIVILIVALFMGYSVIRAGTLATVAAAVVSWLTPFRMGPRSIAKAFELAGVMSIQIIAVCACAGIIVGVISLTGVGARFSALLLGIAGSSQLLALFFAMCIAILLGMGMPTTAAYAVAGSVVAPGLQRLLFEGGLPEETSLLVAHFFVFYYAVLSAITPPVALASYAAAGISGANPMETSVTSFKIGIAAFIVPFMFVYNSALLMDGTWFEVIRAGLTATFGVFLLSAAVQGWFMGSRSAWFIRLAILVAALFMIEGGLVTDLVGIGLFAGAFGVQRGFRPDPDAPIPVRGAD
ncbi:MAG: TRAP transporter permease [Silicimonas sp.]|nr:TRAP transporter permease [Silicimonas sp.]